MNTRQRAQQKIDQTIFHFEKAGEDLAWILMIYDKDHPEVTNPIIMINTCIAECLDALDKLRRTF